MNKISRAFSLIELSIVILIIGILVAGVVQSSRLVKKMRLQTAQNLTTISPIPSIKDLVFGMKHRSIKVLLIMKSKIILILLFGMI